MKKRLASVLFKLLLAAVAAVGVLLVCGIFSGRRQLGQLRYYAVAANAVCALFYFCNVLHDLFSNREFFPRVRGAVVLLLLVSVLLDVAALSGSRSTAVSYLILHYITPFLAVLDWLIFGIKGRYRWSSPVLWLIVPNLYFLFVVLYAKFKAVWLYGFLNAKLHGAGSVILTVLLLNVVALALGFFLVSIDRLTVKRKKRRKRKKTS